MKRADEGVSRETPTAVRARLEALSGQYALPPAAAGQLGVLLERLAGDATAPTTVTEPARAVDVHVADSLSALVLEPVRTAGHIADLGSGPGIPALVLAAALPQAHVTAIESVARKCAFIDVSAAAMGLRNVTSAPERAEEHDGLAAYDLVTARAVAPLNVLVEYAAPLLAEGGTFVAWKGARDEGEERDGAAAASEVGLGAPRVVPVTPFPGSERRHLHLYLKVGSTPNRYPRRPGMARKRPLRASS